MIITTTATTTTAAIALLTGLHKAGGDNFKLALSAFCDLLEELTDITRQELSGVRSWGRKGKESWMLDSLERLAIRHGLLTWEQTPSHVEAEQFQAAVAAVNLARVPVMSTDRHILATAQAKLCRDLFRKLGLKGARITSSKSGRVRVELPTKQGAPGGPDGIFHPFRVANRASEEKVNQILARAFPSHDDRSDAQSDHFDFCWIVS